MKHIICLLTFILSLTNLSLEGQSFKRDYQSHLDQHQDQEIPIPYELLKRQTNLDNILGVIDRTLSNEAINIRAVGYESLDVLHEVFKRTQDHKQVLALQMKALEDRSTQIQLRAIVLLSELEPAYFSASQKTLLISHLTNTADTQSELLRLIGQLGDTSAITAIRPYTQKGISPKLRWQAYLAMARLGDEQAIATLLSKVQNLEVDTDVTYDLVPGLVYTHQKSIYNFLIAAINSNETNCLPADPDQTQPINCAYRILEYIVPEITDFPFGIQASGDLDVEDYSLALQTAREWFAANPDYQIALGE
ncbi:MAG: hypothetical protein RIC35_07285 [Marinoscillum sp.]